MLRSFLGTYAGRCSEHDGYWLFGFLVADLTELRIDLLGDSPSGSPSTSSAAVALAVRRFAEQLRLSGLDRSRVRETRVTLTRLPGAAFGAVHGHVRAGFTVQFVAEAVLDDGKAYRDELTTFVAPHDPAIESRSGRSSAT